MAAAMSGGGDPAAHVGDDQDQGPFGQLGLAQQVRGQSRGQICGGQQRSGRPPRADGETVPRAPGRAARVGAVAVDPGQAEPQRADLVADEGTERHGPPEPQPTG